MKLEFQIRRATVGLLMVAEKYFAPAELYVVLKLANENIFPLKLLCQEALLHYRF